MALRWFSNLAIILVLLMLIWAFAKPVILNIRKKTYGKDFRISLFLLIVLGILSVVLFFVINTR